MTSDTIETTIPHAINAEVPVTGCDAESTRDILDRHRRVWANKPSLRAVYQSYFQNILNLSSSHRPIVELGSGPGFFKAYFPDLIATDIEPTPWIDAVVDGSDLPYADRSIGNIVMVDVFHHIARPTQFMQEASRVLKPGGRVVMLEPWTSPLGYIFYRHIHHEGADHNIDPVNPFAHEKEAFDGNAAVPTMLFTSKNGQPPPGHLEGELHVKQVKKIPAISWLLTGGFQPYCLLPKWLLPVARGLDLLVTPLAKMIALRAIIVLEKP